MLFQNEKKQQQQIYFLISHTKKKSFGKKKKKKKIYAVKIKMGKHVKCHQLGEAPMLDNCTLRWAMHSTKKQR